MLKTLSVFISSKMQELREEREMINALLPTLGDEATRLEAWVFEDDAIASASSIREVYLKALEGCDLYLGLFWNEYGEWTIDEFHHAGKVGITRHIYVKDVDKDKRDPRLVEFLRQQSDVRFGITPRWYRDTDDLRTQITRSIQQWLVERQIAHHSATSAVIATIPDDIPDLPRKLIGRKAITEKVLDLLNDNDLVLLRGFGGTGKTALGATIAADWLEENGSQVIWVRAGTADADAIFEAIARAFDAQKRIANETGEARIQAVKRLLAEQKGLLVLDDAWNGNALATVAKAIPRRMPFMATSRQRFPVGEIIEVGELAPDESRKLLRLHARRDLDDDAAVDNLCKTLGYHAFALEIAGKMMQSYSMSASNLLERIEQAPHDLEMPFGFGELGRTGIKSLLDASIDALNREMHDIFVLLGGLYEPTATTELIALTADREANETESILSDLVERGLVNERLQQEVKYYRLHDLAYSYARTMFRSKGKSEQPIINACQSFARNHLNDLPHLDIEQSNIIEAAEAAYQMGQNDILVDIMIALAVEGPYFAARGHSSHSIQLMETTIAVALSDHKLEEAHYLLSRLGNTYNDFLGNHDKAYETYYEAYELAQKLGLPDREAILLTVLGKVRFLQDEPDASTYYERAENIARSNGIQGALAFVLHHRGFFELNKPAPDYEVGGALSDEAAQLAKDLGLLDIRFHSLINRGAAELELGRVDDALATHEEAYALAKSTGNHPWIAYSSQSIGEDYHKNGQRDRAQEYFDEAIKLWRQIGGKAQIETLTEYLEDHDYQIAG